MQKPPKESEKWRQTLSWLDHAGLGQVSPKARPASSLLARAAHRLLKAVGAGCSAFCNSNSNSYNSDRSHTNYSETFH